MKTILALSILFSAIALPALGELSVQDIEKISSIVKESGDGLKEEIANSEKRTREHIDLKISSVEKQITLLTNFVYGLIALIVVAVGIPQILMARQSLKDNTPQIEEFTQKIIMQLARDPMTELVTKLLTEHTRDQEEKIESLTQEIESLKQHS